MAAKTNAHETCEHAATKNARNKCRRVTAKVATFDALSAEDLKIALSQGETVTAWRIENTSAGPIIVERTGTLSRSYQHRDNIRVWIIVSDDKPEGTGHVQGFIRLAD